MEKEYRDDRDCAEIKYSLIYTPFKSGSSTFFDRMRDQNFIKLHCGINLKDVQYPLKAIFTTIRHPIDLYPSAFFQDIDMIEYPYYIGTQKDVLNCSVDTLVSKFLSFEWSKFAYLSCTACLKELSEYLNIDLLERLKNFDKMKGYMIIEITPQMKLCILKIEILKDQSFLNMLKEMELDYKLPTMNLDSNVADEKWYGKKYEKFKIALRSYDYLSADDYRIIELFY